jgi:hypothetical protein
VLLICKLSSLVTCVRCWKSTGDDISLLADLDRRLDRKNPGLLRCLRLLDRDFGLGEKSGELLRAGVNKGLNHA